MLLIESCPFSMQWGEIIQRRQLVTPIFVDTRETQEKPVNLHRVGRKSPCVVLGG